MFYFYFVMNILFVICMMFSLSLTFFNYNFVMNILFVLAMMFSLSINLIIIIMTSYAPISSKINLRGATKPMV